jgi:hypothetical protein
VAAALAVLASGCSSGQADEADPDPVVTLPEDGSGSGGSDDGSTGNNNNGGRTPTGSGGATPTTASGRTTTTAKGEAGSSTTARPTTTTPRASSSVDTGAKGGVGAYARHLLRPQGAQRIVVEVLAQPGMAPGQATLDHVAKVLRDASGKPVSVPAVVALPAGDGTTNDVEIRELSDRHGRTAQTAEQAVLRLLFLTGAYEGEDDDDSRALGVAVRGDTAAVFEEQVRRTATPPFVTVAQLETSVTTHEVGHLLGLVDLVIDTDRDDPKNPGHSPSKESVMFWAVESNRVSQVLDGPPPRDFDAADRDELAAIRTS